MGWIGRSLLLATAAAAALASAPVAAQSADKAQEIVLSANALESINPTGRTVSLTVPLRESGRYLGDVIANVEPDGSVRTAGSRVLELLGTVVDKKTLDRLHKAPALTGSTLAGSGIRMHYNAQELALDVDIDSAVRRTRDLQVSALDPEMFGSVISPAGFSAYLNGRTNLDYLHGDGGLQSPVVFVDGAARLGPIVAEGEGLWETDGNGFTRSGARLIFDDQVRLVRWTAGDLQPLGRGFQSVPEIAGLSVFRSYGVLVPQRIARPRGDRSFLLTRPSTIEVSVNGQLVRRLQLEPGNYDLRDFPFTQGANDVRLAIRDDAGRSQTINFNVFLDQNQLGRGLTEFGLYAGVLASTDLRGPNYSNELAASGFIRRGITDALTLGANFQGDRRSQMAGAEGIWSSPVGALGGTFALSNLRGIGTGYAAVITFQRLISRGSEAADTLNLFVETRSKNFGTLGTLIPLNPFAWEAGGGYSRALSSSVFLGVDGRYSQGRGDQRTVYSTRGTVGVRISDRLSLAGEARWEKDNFERRLSGLLTATLRLGRSSTVRADYDTRFDRARVSYSTFRGSGVGSYNITGDIDHSGSGTGLNVTANYLANRGELGFSHLGSFDNIFGNSLAQRSSVRLASSVAFADGGFSVGRPVYDSFAIVDGHRSLKGASIEVERTPFGYVAETGVLGTALHPSLSSYLGRTIIVDAPGAPATADLGQGSFKVFPPYRSGYRVTVGSAFNVTAVGKLLDAEGKALSLVSGTVTQSAARGAHEAAIFTNREGRFGATGLAPGKWLARMNDDNRSLFEIVIANDAEGVVTLGELRPVPKPAQELK